MSSSFKYKVKSSEEVMSTSLLAINFVVGNCREENDCVLSWPVDM